MTDKFKQLVQHPEKDGRQLAASDYSFWEGTMALQVMESIKTIELRH